MAASPPVPFARCPDANTRPRLPCFHEIRSVSDQRVVAALRGYAGAGIVLLFIEETGLSASEIRETAWNTYHAGFRYTHELSGQCLRPSVDHPDMRKSWSRCIAEAGYVLLDEFTSRTRDASSLERLP